MKMLGRLLFIILTIMASACLPTTPLPQTQTDPATSSPTVSPTVVWFPATATNTPIPTIGISPTMQKLPEVGQVFLKDNFNTLSSWVTGNPGNGTVALGINEITLVITQPKRYLFSYRNEPILTDFYAEITASPALCAGMDEYGILFRYNSPTDFYRYSLSCDGHTRLDKLVSGIASSPQPWLESISVPKTAPSSSRIGIQAVGGELRFFLNDELQFSVTDQSLSSGLIGTFARSAAENAVTISFSDLVIYYINP